MDIIGDPNDEILKNLLEAVPSLKDERISFISVYNNSDGVLKMGQEIRGYCEANLCGLYGRNWACPPNVPSLDICRIIVSKYEHFVLIRTTFPRDGPFDIDGMRSAGKSHSAISRKIREELRQYTDGKCFVLAAGGCGFCQSCTCPEEKCRFPNEKMNSIESYCIDLDSFLLKNNIERRGGNSEQSYFSMFFF